MLAGMSSRQYAELQAFLSIEPIGEERADLRSAVMPWLYASANRGKGSAPPKLQDFLLNFDGGEAEPLDTETQQAIWKTIDKALQAKRKNS